MLEFKTQRLTIKPLTLDDAQAVQDLITEKISRWTAPIPWPHTLENAVWWIENSAAEKHMGIFLDNLLIGATNLALQNGEEVGFWMNEKFEGQRFATEAAAAMIDYSFKNYGLDYLESSIHIDNLASRRIHEKLAYVLTGEKLNFWRNRNAEVPVAVYRLTKLDWQKSLQSGDASWRV